jgi:hypothetical protein
MMVRKLRQTAPRDRRASGGTDEGATDVADISPKLNSPDRPQGLSRDDADRLVEAASVLKQATDDLAQAIVSGRPIGRASARDRFDIALAEFSALTDRTREA